MIYIYLNIEHFNSLLSKSERKKSKKYHDNIYTKGPSPNVCTVHTYLKEYIGTYIRNDQLHRSQDNKLHSQVFRPHGIPVAQSNILKV